MTPDNSDPGEVDAGLNGQFSIDLSKMKAYGVRRDK